VAGSSRCRRAGGGEWPPGLAGLPGLYGVFLRGRSPPWRVRGAWLGAGGTEYTAVASPSPWLLGGWGRGAQRGHSAIAV